MKKILRNKNFLIALITSVFIATPLLLTARMQVIYSFTDLFILNSKKLYTVFYSWQTLNLGQTGANSLWRIAPMDLFYDTLNYLLHLQPSLTHALFLTLVCLAGFASFYAFITEMFPKVSFVARMIGGVMFIFNLYNQLNISTSFLFAVVYLILPLQLTFLLKSLRTKRYIYYGLMIGLMNALTFGVNLAYSAIAVASLVILGLWQIYVMKNAKFIDLIKVLISTGISTLLLIAWWLAPMLYANLVDRKTTDFVLASESFNGLDSTIWNVLRNLGDWSFFSGYRGQPYHIFAYLYKDVPLIVITSYTVPILVISAFIFFANPARRLKNNKIQIFLFLIVSILLLPVIGGTNSTWPTHDIAEWVFAHVPFAMAFRSTYKFTEVVAFSYVIILTIFFDELLAMAGKMTRPKYLSFGLTASFILLIFLNTIPMWTGNLFENKNKIASLPSYWTQMSEYINANTSSNFDRVMLLPDQYFPVFQWNGERKALPSDQTEILFTAPVVHGVCRGCAPYYTSNLLHYIYDNFGKANLDKFLATINVTKLLQRDDFDYEYYSGLSPSKIKSLIESYASIYAVKSIGPLHFYSFKNDIINPRVYSPSQIVGVENFDGALDAFDEYEGIIKKNAFLIQDQNKNTVSTPRDELFQLFRQDIASISNSKISQSFETTQNTTYKIVTKPNSANVFIPTIDNQKLDQTSISNSIYLSKGQHTISSPIEVNPQELLPNGSFESGLWEPKVGDCKQENPKPQLGMRTIKDASNGKAALELTANVDTACIHSSQILGFDKTKDYLVSFDYKVIAGNSASYCIWDGYRCINTKILPKQQSSIWQHVSIPVELSNDSEYLSIYLYAPAGDSGRSTVDFDNVSIKSLSTNILDSYDLLPVEKDAVTPISLNVNRVNPTRIDVQATVKQAGLVVFQEAFNPGWRAYIVSKNSKPTSFWDNITFKQDGYRLAENTHLVMNGFSNGWWIDPNALPANIKDQNGEYKIILEYWPQRWFYFGLTISSISLVFIIVCAVLYKIRMARRQKDRINDQSRRVTNE